MREIAEPLLAGGLAIRSLTDAAGEHDRGSATEIFPMPVVRHHPTFTPWSSPSIVTGPPARAPEGQSDSTTAAPASAFLDASLDASPGTSPGTGPGTSLPTAGAGPAAAIAVRAGSALPWRLRPARSAGFVPMDRTLLQAPSIPPSSTDATLRFPAGTGVRATISGQVVDGVVQGFDYKGRAVLDADGQRRICDHAALAAVTPSGARASVLAALPAQAVVVPPARLAEALDAALDVVVNGSHTAREYTDAFRARGYEVFVVGGGVRDAIRVLSANPQADRQDLLAVLNDIDIVTTAPPPVARELCAQLAPELADGGVWSPRFVEQFGVVLAGGKKAGQKDSEGLDICSLKRVAAGREMVLHPDTGEKAFPSTFGADLMSDARARDFCCNALYYEPHHGVIVDPTLQGIADAEHSLLHPVVPAVPAGAPLSEAPLSKAPLSEESSLSPRFWKFRLRGFKTDGESLATLRRHAETVFSTRTGKERWTLQSTLGRVAPKDASTRAAVEDWLVELRAIMRADHCADLFDRAVQGGVRDGVIAEVLKRTTKGLDAAAPSTSPHPATGAGSTTTGGDG